MPCCRWTYTQHRMYVQHAHTATGTRSDLFPTIFHAPKKKKNFEEHCSYEGQNLSTACLLMWNLSEGRGTIH